MADLGRDGTRHACRNAEGRNTKGQRCGAAGDGAPIDAELRRSRAAYAALGGTGIASDVLVWTASQFNSRAPLAASLPATVIREGKLLHAA
jgi:hypothetical protein